MVIVSRFMTVQERVNFVEWIESSGTQFIDTEVGVPCTVEATLQGVVASSVYSVVLSAGTEEVAGRWFAFNSSGWSIWENGFPTAYNEKIAVTCEWNSTNLTATINGVVKSKDATITGNICVGSPWGSFPAKCKIYGLKIYCSGALVRDLWPCYDPDGVACMYDKVQGKYYYNKGSGEFVAGGVSSKPVEPDGSAPVITVTGSGMQSISRYADITVNGKMYYNPAKITVARGTEMVCSVYSSTSAGLAYVTVNGLQVAAITGGTTTYTYVVTQDCTVNIWVGSAGAGLYTGVIDITTS